MKKTILGLAVLAMLMGTITSGQDFGVDESSQKASTAIFKSGITVMTRNIYVGADVDRVIAGEEGALQAVMEQLFSTSYPDRAGGLANEILSARPHLIGIQEASFIAGNILWPLVLINTYRSREAEPVVRFERIDQTPVLRCIPGDR